MKDSSRLPALDGLRGVAALMVCIYHTRDYCGVSSAVIPRVPLAVDLFFILSGFVIARSYERRLVDGSLPFRHFVLVRLVRLYPMYLLSVLLVGVPLVLAVLVHHNRPEPVMLQYVEAALLGLLMLPMRVSDEPMVFYPLNVAYWSLFFEFITNFIYAEVACRRWLSNRVLPVVVAAAATALVLIVAANRKQEVDALANLGPFWGGLLLTGGFVRALFGFSAGVLLFRMRGRLPRWLGGCGYGLPLAVVTLLLVTPSIGAQRDWMLQLFGVIAILPLCVAASVMSAQYSGSAIVDHALLTLGRLSYPIYVLHMSLVHLLDAVSGRRMPLFAPWSELVLLLLLVAVALAADRYLDRPVRRWLMARAFERDAVPAATIAAP